MTGVSHLCLSPNSRQDLGFGNSALVGRRRGDRLQIQSESRGDGWRSPAHHVHSMKVGRVTAIPQAGGLHHG
jgi:hypothetical protein